MRDDGRDVCLRVLGLGPGASAQEIKAAYRDLAKVWHPDRFAHDPRLQQKAQEQLKEINEAYQRLVSGNFATPRARASHSPRPPRAAHTPPRPNAPSAAHERSREAAATTTDERVATRPRRNVSRVALAAPALAFCATFAFVTPRLLSTNRTPEPAAGAPAASAPARDDDAQSSSPADANTVTAEAADARAQQKNQAASRQQMTHAAETAAAAAATAAQPARAMPTVTVSIDPSTGLRARAGCPHKSAMTFPAGDEPSAYCDAHNTPAPQRAAAAGEARAGKAADDSRGKSFASRIGSSTKKLFGGGRSSDKEPARDN